MLVVSIHTAKSILWNHILLVACPCSGRGQDCRTASVARVPHINYVKRVGTELDLAVQFSLRFVMTWPRVQPPLILQAEKHKP